MSSLWRQVSRVDADFEKILQQDLREFDQSLEHANLVPLADAAGSRAQS